MYNNDCVVECIHKKIPDKKIDVYNTFHIKKDTQVAFHTTRKQNTIGISVRQIRNELCPDWPGWALAGVAIEGRTHIRRNWVGP